MTAEPVQPTEIGADLRHVRSWIFDLDDTLYPPERQILKRVSERIGHFMVRATGLPPDEARALQKRYLMDHGAALGGLMKDYTIDPEEFLADVRSKGERLRSALEQMIPNHDHLFESVRGVGLMLGIKMKTDSRQFVNWLRGQGLLAVAAGDNVMRVLPPLIIDESHIKEFVEGLSAAAAKYDVPAAAA